MPLASWPIAVNHQTGVLEYASSVSAGGALAYKSYTLGVDKTTTSSTFADVNTANLLVTFTVPASGSVVVTLSAGATAGATTTHGWNLRDGSGDIAGTTRVALYNSASAVTSVSVPIVVTGLTPGASLTWKWGHGLTSGTNSSLVASATPCTMVVLGLP